MSCHLPLWACRGIYPRNSGRGRCSTLGAGGMIISASILNALSMHLNFNCTPFRQLLSKMFCVGCAYTGACLHLHLHILVVRVRFNALRRFITARTEIERMLATYQVQARHCEHTRVASRVVEVTKQSIYIVDTHILSDMQV